MEGKVLVAGASGALGMEILKILNKQEREIRVLVHSAESAEKVSEYTSDIWIADAIQSREEVSGISQDITSVISAMGKSVSLFTNRGKSFLETDFYANNNILDDAIKAGVSRFVYVSIKGVEQAHEYEIAKSHKMFEDALQNSGLSFSIIRPVGFFSGLNDLAIMAKRRLVPVVGDGLARTNSIHQKDLAQIVVESLEDGVPLREVGGPLVHTRMEMAQMLSKKLGAEIFRIPEKLAEWGMIIPKFFDDDVSEKLEYFKYVTTNDMIGEKTGSISFAQYLEDLDIKKLP